MQQLVKPVPEQVPKPVLEQVLQLVPQPRVQSKPAAERRNKAATSTTVYLTADVGERGTLSILEFPETVPAGFVALTLPGGGSNEMFRTYWFPRQALSTESNSDVSGKNPEQSVPQPVPQPHISLGTQQDEIEKLDTDNDEEPIRTPRRASRVCGPPLQQWKNVGETPLNLSAAEALEKEMWSNSKPFLTRTIPAGYESSDNEDNCITQ